MGLFGQLVLRIDFIRDSALYLSIIKSNLKHTLHIRLLIRKPNWFILYLEGEVNTVKQFVEDYPNLLLPVCQTNLSKDSFFDRVGVRYDLESLQLSANVKAITILSNQLMLEMLESWQVPQAWIQDVCSTERSKKFQHFKVERKKKRKLERIQKGQAKSTKII